MTDPYIPPLTFPLRVTEAHPTPHPRSDLWDANGMFIANISTAWAVQIRDATVGAEPAAEPTFPQRLRELARKWGDKNETNLAKMLREAAGMIEGGR